uniref:Small ribosomal subunit protein uS4c n=1 Tax=Prasinococcus sp. CCMP1194 TaxID=110672 RepID=A0A650AKP4_9VIRI|nr:ribosomal protein S4 [Prasinococcus sp. CCMP1194]|eukprot:scaffold5782_cov618-Prasinococcus_capsulatus_cf.AAC.21
MTLLKKNVQKFSHDLWRTAKTTYTPSSRPAQSPRKGKKKLSDYGKRLQARALLKALYGQMRTKYVRKLVHEASKMRFRRAAALLTLLESRLDVLLFRSGVACSLEEAHQFISHKKISVNGYIMTRPKCILRPGDIFSFPPLREGSSLEEKNQSGGFERFKPGKLLKPLHVELSYTIGHGIYLYRPQSLLFPRRPFPDLAIESFSQ